MDKCATIVHSHTIVGTDCTTLANGHSVRGPNAKHCQYPSPIKSLPRCGGAPSQVAQSLVFPREALREYAARSAR